MIASSSSSCVLDSSSKRSTPMSWISPACPGEWSKGLVCFQKPAIDRGRIDWLIIERWRPEVYWPMLSTCQQHPPLHPLPHSQPTPLAWVTRTSAPRFSRNARYMVGEQEGVCRVGSTPTAPISFTLPSDVPTCNDERWMCTGMVQAVVSEHHAIGISPNEHHGPDGIHQAATVGLSQGG